MPKRLTQAERDRRAADKEANRAERERARDERKAKAEREKGRKSLRGLDRFGFAAALDAVQEGRIETPNVEKVRIAKMFRDDSEDVRGTEYAAYFRVAHCPVDIMQAMMRAWPDFRVVVVTQFGRVAVRIVGGQTAHTVHVDRKVPTRIPVFPVARVVTLFAAIWPDKWQYFAMKYLHGYTRLYVDNSEALARIQPPAHEPADPFGIARFRLGDTAPVPPSEQDSE